MSYLLWILSNIDSYFDKGSFISIDIDNHKDSFEVIDKAINNPDIINMINIREARRAVLLDYNMLNLINMAIDRYDEISHENKKISLSHFKLNNYQLILFIFILNFPIPNL